jgi:hypothetical protein
VARYLSNLELDILRKLVSGEAVSLSSQQRLRLELTGVIREGAHGIVVTADGRRLASQKLTESAPSSPSPQIKSALDKRGRRLPHQRRSVF